MNESNFPYFTNAIFGVFFCIAFSSSPSAHDQPPEPSVTYQAGEAEGRIEHGERIADVDKTRKALHIQHHPHSVLETRQIPGHFDVPNMDKISDFALAKDKLVVINPGPGEYVHVMEGQRHGYQSLTIGITYTAPGGASTDAYTSRRRVPCSYFQAKS